MLVCLLVLLAVCENAVNNHKDINRCHSNARCDATGWISIMCRNIIQSKYANQEIDRLASNIVREFLPVTGWLSKTVKEYLRMSTTALHSA